MVAPGWMSIGMKPGRKLPTRTIIKNHLKEWNTNNDKKEKTHKCLANMKEHKLSECPSLKGFEDLINDEKD